MLVQYETKECSHQLTTSFPSHIKCMESNLEHSLPPTNYSLSLQTSENQRRGIYTEQIFAS